MSVWRVLLLTLASTAATHTLHMQTLQAASIVTAATLFPSICSDLGNQRASIRGELLSSSSKQTVATREDCLLFCFVMNEIGEVCQMWKLPVEVEDSGWRCSLASVSTRQLLLFPWRYLQCTEELQVAAIFVRRASHSLETMSRSMFSTFRVGDEPLLLFTLSGGPSIDNLGQRVDVSVERPGGPVHFDCPFNGQQGNFARLVSSENPQILVNHTLNNTFTGSKGFKWMAWAKKINQSSCCYPILDGMIGSTMMWNMWNYDTNSINGVFNGSALHFCIVMSSGNAFQTVYADFSTWFHFAAVYETLPTRQLTVFVNGIKIGSAVPVAEPLRFGEKFLIGKRIDPTIFVWPGCLAHVMLFNRSLTGGEIKNWMGLVNMEIV